MRMEEKVFVYSETLVAFVRRAEEMVWNILRRECGLEVRKARFLYRDYIYSLDLVVFESGSRMGYFDPDFFEIGINQELAFGASEDVLKNLLRHELAHFLQWIETHGADLSSPHGSVYRAICARYGWGQDVYQASGSLDGQEGKVTPQGQREQVLISKVKKLIALAGSSNLHEAELATRKANELITKYNLSFFNHDGEPASDSLGELIMKRVLPYKRLSAKYKAIRKILETFGVRAVFSPGCLSIAGPRASVQVAEYVGSFLERHFETLYREAQKKDPSFRGTSKKNSFFIGIGNGYQQKIKDDQRKQVARDNDSVEFSRGAGDPHAITLLALDRYHDSLEEKCNEWIYRRLRAHRSGAFIDAASLALGKETGRALTIATPLTAGPSPSHGNGIRLLESGR